jgi:hypothetical protein
MFENIRLCSTCLICTIASASAAVASECILQSGNDELVMMLNNDLAKIMQDRSIHAAVGCVQYIDDGQQTRFKFNGMTPRLANCRCHWVGDMATAAKAVKLAFDPDLNAKAIRWCVHLDCIDAYITVWHIQGNDILPIIMARSERGRNDAEAKLSKMYEDRFSKNCNHTHQQ